MGRVLIIYATTEGQSEKIAKFISREIQAQGLSAELLNSAQSAASATPHDYDGVIVGASVHMGQFPAPLRNWVKANAETLSQMPSAFFSVCLGILQKDDAETQAAERKIVTDFLSWSSWKPRDWTIFAGALVYSKYGWVKRLMMRRIAKKAGGDTDTSRDYEYTDWNEVRQFTRSFVASLGAPANGPEPSI